MNARTMMAAALLSLAACATAQDAKKAAPTPEQAAAEAAKQKAADEAAAAKKAADEKAAAEAKEAADKAAALAAMLPGEAVLDTRPAIAPLGAFEAPVPAEVKLKNGLRILMVERKGAPIEALLFVARRGSTSDPEGLAGLSSITSTMLEAGSAKKSQGEIAQVADAMGASLHVAAAVDGLFAVVSAQPAHLKEMAGLLADVTMKPNFELGEWKKVKAQRLAQLADQLAEPRIAATNAFARALYGSGPLGHPVQGTPQSIGKMELSDVKAFWGGVDPADAVLIAVGSMDQAQVVKALARFAEWKPAKAPKTAAATAAGEKPAGEKAGAPGQATAPADGRPRLVFVEFPGRPQSVLRVGQPAVRSTSPDALALRVMNSVLGGSFTSRLNQNLREKHGYSYGAGSFFAFGRGPGAFAAASSVKTNVTGAALGEMLQEIDRAAKEPLSSAELEKGKALLAYQLVSQLERSDQTAIAVADLFTGDLPLDHLRTMVPRLMALTVDEVQAATRRTLDPATMTIVIAGDSKAVLPQLVPLKLPAPQMRDAVGDKL